MQLKVSAYVRKILSAFDSIHPICLSQDIHGKKISLTQFSQNWILETGQSTALQSL